MLKIILLTFALLASKGFARTNRSALRTISNQCQGDVDCLRIIEKLLDHERNFF